MSDTPTIAQCLQPSRFADSDSPEVMACAGSVIDRNASDLDNAVALFYKVRDGIRYNPYVLALNEPSFLASNTLQTGEAWCVPKAILLMALCRAAGIPARLGLADVRNHLSTARMRSTMQTDVFYFHGYTSIYLNGTWVKATPAFNIELCEKFGLKPLEFDGLQDSLYHEFDVEGNRHMEYLNDRGEYLDLPLEEMIAVFRVHYPNLFQGSGQDYSGMSEAGRWDEDVEREVGSA